MPEGSLTDRGDENSPVCAAIGENCISPFVHKGGNRSVLISTRVCQFCTFRRPDANTELAQAIALLHCFESDNP